MNRRNFTRLSAMGMAATTLPLYNMDKKKKITIPKRLQKGQTVALISPGSYVNETKLERAIQNLESLELKIKLSKHIRKVRGYTAGTDQERLEDLHAAFQDDQVDAIWCARGGYGCTRLLPYLDYKMIRKHPKILIGFSDITALLNSIYQKSCLQTYHGPVASSVFTPYVREQIQEILFEGKSVQILPQEGKQFSIGSKVKNSGQVIGGNLTVLSAMAGTSHFPKSKGKILLLEDIGEKPYRIDRMLTTLRQCMPLKEVAGIILGQFTDCEAGENDLSLSLKETFQDRLSDLGIPVIGGFPFGHEEENGVIPIGGQVEIDPVSHILRIAASQ